MNTAPFHLVKTKLLPGEVQFDRFHVTHSSDKSDYDGAMMRTNKNGQCSGWKAWGDKEPPGPGTLHLEGKCTFPTTGYHIEVKPVVPQGTNPKILILKRIVHAPTGVVNEVITEVPATYSETTNTLYDEVNIRPDDLHLKVKWAR